MSFVESFNWFLEGNSLPSVCMRFLSPLVAILAFLLGACERHNWEDVDENGDKKIDQNEKGTKRLYMEHKEDEGEEKH